MAQPYFVQHRLQNELIDSPVERLGTSIQVDFEDTIQGNVETGTFTFVNEAFTIINNAVKNGLSGGNGIFEGIPYEISIQKGLENESIFKGSIDMKSLEFLQPNEPKIQAGIIKQDGLNSLSEKLEGLTFALLESVGAISKDQYQDVRSIVEKRVTFVEQAVLALAIYSMLKEIFEAARRIAETAATISSILASSITGQVGALVYAILSLIFEAAYIALMAVALFDLVQSFVNNLLPIPKTIKGIKLRTALNSVFQYLGYTFNSPITELDEYVYLPSKAEGRQDKGIPFDSDFGFIASEFVDFCKRIFKAELFIVDDVVQFRTKKDPYFQKQSTYILPDVLEKSFSYNTNELNESVLISFREDLSDEYTINNWKGTSYVVTTRPNTFTNEKLVQMNGLNEVRINLSLGDRKKELSSLENALNAFLQVADALFSVFNSSNSFDQILDRVGLLKTSQDYFNNPKLLKIKNDKLPSDYRDSLSAKYLWDNYLNYDSFIDDNYSRQRKVYEGVQIPFSYSDYKKVLDNSYFTTSEGKKGKITSLNWIIESDRAEIDYYIEEIYTKNLKEEFFEVE